LVGVDDRQPRDRGSCPQSGVEVLNVAIRADGDRVADHPGLGPLDDVDLVGLVLDRQVAVQHPEPPWRAMAIAIRDSVTVSIAAETSGIRIEISRVSLVVVSTSLGMTSVSPGSRQQDVVVGDPARTRRRGPGQARLPSASSDARSPR
jgi:hypothetical protein